MSDAKNKTGADTAVHVVLITPDADLVNEVKSALAASKIAVVPVEGHLDGNENRLRADQAAAAIIDLDENRQEDIDALKRVMPQLQGRLPVVIVTRTFEERLTRQLLKLRVTDFLIKPIKTADIVRTCQRAVHGSDDDAQHADAKIITFFPAGGGVGVTTLALQAAFLFHGEQRRTAGTTCVADLNFQHGACADFLDLEPRLDLNEVEPRPERLDRQLLEVMISRHDSGLSIIAAPNRPAEMRSFDPAMVTRLLDLVSAYFDTVVIDMPRTWFSWTDSVLLGSDKLFIVSEATVPSLRQAQRLIEAIDERFGGDVRPQVIVNRFDRRRFSSGLQLGDIENVLSGRLAGTVCNNYQLVREAVDRGVPIGDIEPNNNITQDLRKVLLPEAAEGAGRSRRSWLPFRRATA